MLQRQIMFKQLKELQQNQQLHDLGDSRNQEYLNQLGSLKQSSGVQFASNVGEPPLDPQMHALGNMRMMQQGGANVYQGFPTGFPGQNHGQGILTPQFDVSGYGSVSSNSDKNLNPYSQFQGLSSQSDNMLPKNNCKFLGTSGINPSSFSSSFGSQQSSFTSDQISIADGALLPNQMFQENNLFGEVPAQSLNNNIVSGNYSNQRIRVQRDEDTSWQGASPFKGSNLTIPDADASLDPLERKILYETDDDSLGLLFGGSQLGKGDFNSKTASISYGDKFQSQQSGIWSALMQSAVAEEDWSGLSFHGQDQPADNMPLTVIKNQKHQNVWVDRNLDNASSSSAELQKSDVNYGFPGLQLSGHHYRKSDEELQPNSSHPLGRQFQQNLATEGTQLFQTLPSSNGLPFQCDEAKGPVWLHGGTSISASSGMQDTFDQVNHMNGNRFSVEPHKMVSGGNEEPMSTTFLASSVSHGKNMNVQRRMTELLNKDEMQNDIMQQNSRTSYSPVGNSRSTSIQSPYVNDYIKNSSPQNHMAAKFPVHTGPSQANFKPSAVSADSQHFRTPMGPPTSSQHISSQQELSSPKAHRFPSNLFRSNDSSSSHLETNSASPNEQSSEKEVSMNPFRVHNLIPPSCSVSQQPSQYTDKKDTEVFPFPSGVRALGQPLNPNNPIFQQVISPRDSGIDKKSGSSYDANSQQTLANDVTSHGALMRGEHNERSSPAEAQEDQSGRVSSPAEVQVLQPGEMYRETEFHSHSTSMNETSNGAFASPVSLQMALSWFKNVGTLNNCQLVSQIGTGNLQGNAVSPASSSSILAGLLPQHNLSSIDANSQNLDVSMAKKRKVVAFETMPWHKEVKNDAPRLQNISMEDLEWAQASNSKLEEVKLEAEIIDEPPVVQAKRRLVFTTLLTQKVLRPAPAAILSEDANSMCDSVAYFASRLVLGGLCNMKSKPSSDADETLNDKPKTPGRTSDANISKIVKGLESRVKKIEADLSRLDKSILMVDVKAENQELEKISIINRFARLHSRPYQSAVDQGSSSGPKPCHLQRYISASPMPKVIPEELDCLSL